MQCPVIKILSDVLYYANLSSHSKKYSYKQANIQCTYLFPIRLTIKVTCWTLSL